MVNHIAVKQRLAAERKSFRSSGGADIRRPAGQHVTRDFPVLDLGTQPVVSASDWELKIGGAVRQSLTVNWGELDHYPIIHLKSDIHCVTGWTKYNNLWRGIRPKWFVEQVQPASDVSHVMARGYDGYSTVIPTEAFTDDQSLIATHWNDEPLNREHGGPVRLVIPRLYFWKSLKWLHSLTFITRYQHGYWEAQGYHPEGDPWKEQRYE